MIRLLMIAALSCLVAACGGGEPETPAEPETPSAGEVDSGTQGGGGVDFLNADGQPTGALCGGIAALTCASEDDFCQMAEGQCWMPDASGTCMPRPQACTREYRPVCGCDGETYANACEAAAAGTSIFNQGACEGDQE